MLDSFLAHNKRLSSLRSYGFDSRSGAGCIKLLITFLITIL